jgi:C4-dicarboxylate transporter DctM subunit
MAMTEVQLAYLLFGSFILCLLLGIPIAFSLAISVLLVVYFSGVPLIFAAETFFSGLDIFPLMAIPGFLLAGNLMTRSGTTEKIVNVMYELVGNVPGGLGIVTVLSSMFFAALCGSGPATTGAIGAIMYPAMKGLNYGRRFSSAVIATGGTLGILIPPSNPMIIYGVIANVSIAGMFTAGILPGMVLSFVLVSYCVIIGRVKRYVAFGKPFSLRRLVRSINEGKFALLMPVLVLGSIYGGYATPTEASILAVLYALFLGRFIYRQLPLKIAYQCFLETAQLTGAILIIMGPAVAFGKILTMCNIPAMIGRFIVSISEDPIVILILIALLLLIVEAFMETLTSIVILTPIFLPPLVKMGVDPAHFGVLFVVLSEIGFLTPPIGANLYVSSAISGVSVEEITLGVIPFIILMSAVVLLFIYFPAISTVGYYLVAK